MLLGVVPVGLAEVLLGGVAAFVGLLLAAVFAFLHCVGAIIASGFHL